MARRRLLSILAGSALLTATFAGPAAAVELVDASQEPVAEVAEEPVEVADQAVEDVVDTVVDEPVAEVTEVIEETVAPEPEPTPAPTEPADEEPAAPAAASSDEPTDALVAAGEVTAAPSLAFLTGTGGSAAPAAQSRLDLPPATPAVDSAPPASETVPAPQVAPAPAAATVAPAPSVAQTVTRAVRDEGTPIVVLVAIASLLAAGIGTVRGARAAAA